MALTKVWPRYARHPLPWKVFAMLMIPTAAFFTTTDVAAMELDREFAQQFSITPKIESKEKQYNLTSVEGVKTYFRDNQYSVIGYGWLALMLGSLGYNFSKPSIALQQKVCFLFLIASLSMHVWYHKLVLWLDW